MLGGSVFFPHVETDVLFDLLEPETQGWLRHKDVLDQVAHIVAELEMKAYFALRIFW